MTLTFNQKKVVRQHLKSVNDVLTFGKMNGCTVADICHDEPSYLTWLEDKEIITIDRDLREIIWEAIASKNRDGDEYPDWGDEVPY
jgi:hypothetical protein